MVDKHIAQMRTIFEEACRCDAEGTQLVIRARGLAAFSVMNYCTQNEIALREQRRTDRKIMEAMTDLLGFARKGPMETDERNKIEACRALLRNGLALAHDIDVLNHRNSDANPIRFDNKAKTWMAPLVHMVPTMAKVRRPADGAMTAPEFDAAVLAEEYAVQRGVYEVRPSNVRYNVSFKVTYDSIAQAAKRVVTPVAEARPDAAQPDAQPIPAGTKKIDIQAAERLTTRPRAVVSAMTDEQIATMIAVLLAEQKKRKQAKAA